MSEKTTFDHVLSFFGLILLAPLIMVATAGLQGMALAKIWLWYAVPTFGAPPISAVVAWGLSLMISLATMRVSSKQDDRPSVNPLQSILGTWLGIAFVWFAAWVGTFFLNLP